MEFKGYKTIIPSKGYGIHKERSMINKCLRFMHRQTDISTKKSGSCSRVTQRKQRERPIYRAGKLHR